VRKLVEALCSDECAGRRPGTPGGEAARALIVEAMRDAGLDPFEQEVPGCKGANVLATLPGKIDRWIMIAAHHDHLGKQGKTIYRGADDNAAASAVLIETARALVRDRPDGRGVIVASFDGEEPPYFQTKAMGSMFFAAHPTVPLESIDLMVCMDLVGHAVGDERLPANVRNTVFALGAERSVGTPSMVDAISVGTPGVVVRRADAEIIPPLSDHAAFWERKRPFMLLTNGRSRVYHTPEDTPDKLDYEKMAATAKWLTKLVRDQCERSPYPFVFQNVRDDESTLSSLYQVTSLLAPFSDEAAMGKELAAELYKQCRKGQLPDRLRGQLESLVAGLEGGLA
jgi:hypothetical protein